jgi:hypothetical protein
MHTARIPPVDPAPATITAVLVMHTGHIMSSYEPLIRPCLSGDAALPTLIAPGTLPQGTRLQSRPCGIVVPSGTSL